MASGDDDDPFWRVACVDSSRVIEGDPRPDNDPAPLEPRPSRSFLVPALVPFEGCVLDIRLEVFDVTTGVGGVLWTGALVLAAWLLAHRKDTLQGRRVCELGAGVGLVGLSVAMVGGAVETVLTDVDPQLVHGLEDAIERNGVTDRATAARVDWFEPATSVDLELFDTVIGAEVIYNASHGQAVVETLERMLAPHGSRAYVVSREGRLGVGDFVAAARSAEGLELESSSILGPEWLHKVAKLQPRHVDTDTVSYRLHILKRRLVA